MTPRDRRTVDPEAWPSTAEPYTAVRPASRGELLPKRVLATTGFLVGCLPRRRSGRRALWVLIVLLTLGGAGMLVYPAFTQFWGHRLQTNLKKDFTTQQSVDAYKKREVKVGGALTRLKIPKLGVNVIVVEGITGNALRAGAGHYPETALPGEPGNVAIAGHRTGFGQPFRNLDRLRKGDLMILETPVGTYTYEVIGPFEGHGNPWVTNPQDFGVIAPTADAQLTLTTCDPPHTSKNRLIVRGVLIKSEIPTA